MKGEEKLEFASSGEIPRALPSSGVEYERGKRRRACEGSRDREKTGRGSSRGLKRCARKKKEVKINTSVTHWCRWRAGGKSEYRGEGDAERLDAPRRTALTVFNSLQAAQARIFR